MTTTTVKKGTYGKGPATWATQQEAAAKAAAQQGAAKAAAQQTVTAQQTANNNDTTPAAPGSPFFQVPLTAPATAASGLTTQTWAIAVLEAYNNAHPTAIIPITLNNVDNMTRWVYAESHGNQFSNGAIGNWLRDNNPLNTGPATGAALGPIGTYVYSSPLAGIQGTAGYLGMSNYTKLVAALRNNAPPELFGAALEGTPWASGHYVFNGVETNFATIPAWVSGTGLTNSGTTETAAQAAAAGNPANPTAGGDAGAAIPVSFTSDVTTALNALWGSIPFKRILVGLGGAAIATVGLVLFLSSTKEAHAATRLAATAAGG